MFEGPEYASYIALCRELRLERQWQDEDAYIVDGETIIDLHGTLTSMEEVRDAAEEHGVWLPRLDQWLAMLEETYAAKWKEATAGPCRPGQARKMALDMLAVASERFPRESIEEIAARLWCAVTGRVTGEKVSP